VYLRLRLDRVAAGSAPPHRLARAISPAVGQAMSVLDLQRLAGNRAVAAELGSMREGRRVVAVGHAVNVVPSAPPKGLQEIRATKGGRGILGNTVTSIEPSPPLLRPEPPTKTAEGWTSRARRARVPELDFEVLYPTAGRHELAPHNFLDVTEHWSEQIHEGEKEHVEDGLLAWQSTWKLIGKVIEALAKESGPAQPSSEAATLDLWRRFVSKLPSDLRPEGDAPTEESQTAKWGMDEKTLFRTLLGATTRRDTRSWHAPSVDIDHIEGKDEYKTLSKGNSRIREVTPEDLLSEVRAKAVKDKKSASS